MKKKDLVYLLLAVVIFLVAGYLGYTQLFASKQRAAASAGVTVDVIGVIPSSVDTSAVSTLNDTSKVRDFNSPVDLSGLGNTAPFGP